MKGWIPIHSQLGDILFIFSRDRQEGSLRRFSIYSIHNQLNYVVWKLLVGSFSSFSKTWHHEIISGWCPAYVKTLSDLMLFFLQVKGQRLWSGWALLIRSQLFSLTFLVRVSPLWPIPLLFICILAWIKESWLPVLNCFLHSVDLVVTLGYIIHLLLSLVRLGIYGILDSCLGTLVLGQ